jgi:hypothetical protein
MGLRHDLWSIIIRVWQWGVSSLWVLMLVGLPLTTFPFLALQTGAIVTPFSVIPLGVLAVVWFLPYLLRNGKLPQEGIPLAVFGVVVSAIAAYAYFLDMGNIKDATLLSQTVRSFIPFGIGLAFYFMVSAWPLDALRLRRVLQAIYLGGALLLLWSVAQAIAIFAFHGQYPGIMKAIRSVLVVQTYTVETLPRLSGLSYEGSWFDHQLNMLYLPLWLAATYRRTSVFPRLWKISLENLFLVVGIGVFLLSWPRIGLVAFMLMSAFLFLKLNVALYRWVIHSLTFRWVSQEMRSRLFKVAMTIFMVIAFVGLYVGFSALLIKVSSSLDWRLALLTQSLPTKADMQQVLSMDEHTIIRLGYRYAFGERTIYWMTGWKIFNDYPWVGVGLGNAGFYFQSHLAYAAWASAEVRQVIYNNSALPNIKSIWFRLLAETGIVGFSIFIIWLVVILQSTLSSQHSRDDTIKTLALAGQLALLAFLMEGLSVDTFGLPYLWVITGLAAAAGRIYRQEIASRSLLIQEIPSG